MFIICKDRLDRLHPAPQYRLWRRKADDGSSLPAPVLGDTDHDAMWIEDECSEATVDSDMRDDSESSQNSVASWETERAEKGTTKEVIPDFVILMPRYESRVDSPAWLQNVNIPDAAKLAFQGSWTLWGALHALTFIFPIWTIIRVTELSIPVLVELKQPLSRNPNGAKAQMNQLFSALKKAKAQVHLQGKCLFMAGRFLHQQQVILMAGVGDFWSFTYMHRPGNVSFDPRAYAEAAGIDDAEEGEESAREFMAIPRPLEKDPKRKSSAYSIEELNNEWRRKANKDSEDSLGEEWIATSPLKSKIYTGLKGGGQQQNKLVWSPILRIGTEASYEAAVFISKELGELLRGS